MHIIIALLCFSILLSISPTARRLAAVVILLGIGAYALQCGEGGKTASLATTAQAAVSGVSGTPNEQTKACQTQVAKGLACLNLRTEDLEDRVDRRRRGVNIAPILPPRASNIKIPVEPRTVVAPIGLGPNFVEHNGSVMEVLGSVDGGVNITYAYPRRGLWELVAPGTLYVHGQWREGILYATAYVFSHQCGPIPYQVSGGIEPDGNLVLNGPAPLVDPLTCQVIQWIWSDNSTVVFTPFSRYQR